MTARVRCILMALLVALGGGCGAAATGGPGDAAGLTPVDAPAADTRDAALADATGADAGGADAADADAAGADAGGADAGDDGAGCQGVDPVAARAAAMALLRASDLLVNQGWRFATDPQDVGVTQGWASTTFDDSGWATMDAGQPWEDQGYPGYDGHAWYRQWIDIPADWAGSPVRVVASGVDDEYDLYVNGQLVKHYGQAPDRSVWNWRTAARVDALLDFGAPNLITFRVNDWGGNGGLWRNVEVKRAPAMDPYRCLVPAPIVDAHPEWVTLYWAAWQMAFEKVQFGTPANGFVDAYMDEGFNEQIYQWDSSFISLFGRYGRRLFPAMETLDNFYAKQRPDGYIQRVYSETDGSEVGTPTADEPMVNPPLFAWVEWDYYRLTGDGSRLARVLPQLEAYYGWLQANLRAPAGAGLYYQTGLGSGMDNTPRPSVAQGAWVDESAQQALAAWALAQIAGALGLPARASQWTAEHDAVAALINQYLWHIVDGTYYDRTPAGTLTGVKHLGAYWTLLAGVADAGQAAQLAAHLRDPQEFYRPHLFPTLAADDPSYVASGQYWLGSVWAPTEYMVVKGLERAGIWDLAREAAESHLTHVAGVYASPPTDESLIAPEERDGDYRTIWECYGAEATVPATRWDGTYYSRQDFVGWSGLGPIAMLIEDVLGIQAEGASSRVTWSLARTDRHGVERLQLGPDNLVSLVAEARATPSSPAAITIQADQAFHLTVARPGLAAFDVDVAAGVSSVTAP